LKILAWVPYLFRLQQKSSAITTNATTANDPIVIPAIAPPLSPELPSSASGGVVELAVGDAVTVVIGGRFVKVGNTNPTHLCCAFAL
jgi:hypothetical protein